jgi:hypothetical protein
MKKQTMSALGVAAAMVLGTASAASAEENAVADHSEIGLLATSSRGTGKIDCRGSSIRPQEVHTITVAKGTVTAQIYGATGASTNWDHTSSVKLGYSSAYADWNAHHVWEWTSKGGKVFGSDVRSARVNCQ